MENIVVRLGEIGEYNMWKSKRLVYASISVKNNSVKFFHGSDSTQKTRERREKRRLLTTR